VSAFTARRHLMRRGEMLALRFQDIDFDRGLITLGGETTKSKKTRLVPFSTTRLRGVLEWLQLDAVGQKKKKPNARVFTNEVGEPLGTFRTAWVTAVLKAHDVEPKWNARLDVAIRGVQREVPEDRSALARPVPRVRPRRTSKNRPLADRAKAANAVVATETNGG
jgi:integrase